MSRQAFASTAVGATVSPTPATSPATLKITPRASSRASNTSFALLSRPVKVPSFQPSARAASPLLCPSRQASTNGTRSVSGRLATSSCTASRVASHLVGGTTGLAASGRAWRASRFNRRCWLRRCLAHTLMATPCSHAGSLPACRIDPTLRSSTTNTAWNASSASASQRVSCRQTSQTSRPYRCTSAAKLASPGSVCCRRSSSASLRGDPPSAVASRQTAANCIAFNRVPPLGCPVALSKGDRHLADSESVPILKELLHR